MKLEKNNIVPLEITAMTSDGSGIGKIDGMAVFVPLTAVGDKIDAKIVKVAKNYAFGIVDKLLEPSPDRVQSDCPYFNKCGGCVYRHMTYESECKIKESRVRDAIERIGGLPGFTIEPIMSAENRLHYRNKAQLPLGLDRDGKLTMGFYAKHSHRIIDTAECLLQPKVFTSVMEVFRSWFEKFGDTVYSEENHRGVLRHLYIRQGEDTGEIMVCVVINSKTLKNADKLAEMFREAVPAVTSLIININEDNTNVILGEKCYKVFGADTISDRLCGLKFHLSPLSFYQVNRNQAERLYKKAEEYAALTGAESVLDLYCGTGTIGLSMAHKAKKLIGVEIIPSAIENAKVNALENGIANAEFICGDASKAAEILRERGEKPDVVILDPPRKGCDPTLIDTVVKMAPKKIVYVSCDPATLARDIKLFTAEFYKLEKLTPCDLFPATAHVESVALMTSARK